MSEFPDANRAVERRRAAGVFPDALAGTMPLMFSLRAAKPTG